MGYLSRMEFIKLEFKPKIKKNQSILWKFHINFRNVVVCMDRSFSSRDGRMALHILGVIHILTIKNIDKIFSKKIIP